MKEGVREIYNAITAELDKLPFESVYTVLCRLELYERYRIGMHEEEMQKLLEPHVPDIVTDAEYTLGSGVRFRYDQKKYSIHLHHGYVCDDRFIKELPEELTEFAEFVKKFLID
jgi:hypothetical protein